LTIFSQSIHHTGFTFPYLIKLIGIQVEALTAQVQTLESRTTQAEGELKAAVSKIWDLRVVIQDLEQQVQAKAEREDTLNDHIKQLEEVIVAQTKNQQELVQELEIIKSGSDSNHLSDHIGHLQVCYFRQF